jgi:hypothetical protein
MAITVSRSIPTSGPSSPGLKPNQVHQRGHQPWLGQQGLHLLAAQHTGAQWRAHHRRACSQPVHDRLRIRLHRRVEPVEERRPRRVPAHSSPFVPAPHRSGADSAASTHARASAGIARDVSTGMRPRYIDRKEDAEVPASDSDPSAVTAGGVCWRHRSCHRCSGVGRTQRFFASRLNRGEKRKQGKPWF